MNRSEASKDIFDLFENTDDEISDQEATMEIIADRSVAVSSTRTPGTELIKPKPK